MTRTDAFVPALGHPLVARLYDPLLRLTMREQAFKEALVRQAAIAPGQRVLDVGCGTATLTLLAKRAEQRADVVGLDVDPVMLKLASRKVLRSGLEVSLELGSAVALPYADRSFDRVLSSLTLHHLTRDQKQAALREAFRVLKPGGVLHVADWGRPANSVMRAVFVLVQLVDGFATTRDNVAGRLPDMMAAAGFHDARETRRFAVPLGTVSLYRGGKRD
ncbi:MAG TPA: methyltransferase domain-containing protein [Gemmatimonadales bacterium]